ncbi:MAG: hypothetical protein AAF902_19430, partial [Chloroflexota bacterium]
DCKGSAMTDAYRQDYSEFLTQEAWDADPECQQSLAETATGLSDWETILHFYGSFISSDQSEQTKQGPIRLPLDVTKVIISGTHQINDSILDDPFFYLNNEFSESISTQNGKAAGYLFRTQGTSDVSDDEILPLGSPVGPLLHGRGAHVGDKICVYDYSLNAPRIGCEIVDNLQSTITLEQSNSEWQPIISVSPLSETSLEVYIQNAGNQPVDIQVFPSYRPTEDVKAPNQSLNLVNGSGKVIFEFPLTVFQGHVKVTLQNSSPLQELIIPFSITPKWDGNSFIAWGGNQIIGWDGNSFIAWGGNSFIAWGGNSFIAWGGNSFIAWGAPVASSDGQVMLFDTNNITGGGHQASPSTIMQALPIVPNLPDWYRPVGQAYRYSTDGPTNDGLVIQFRYLEREIPLISENTLNIYHLPENGDTWEKLETSINEERNLATAQMEDVGTYALIATVELPVLALGWNNFGYPLQESRLIDNALASIEGKYTSLYKYDPSNPSQWQMFDIGVLKQHPVFHDEINTLRTFEFGQAYWIFATEPTVAYFEVEGSNGLRSTDQSGHFPPATFFGHILDSDYQVGMQVEAKIGNVSCGQTELKQIDSQVAYVIQVQSDLNNGCGTSSDIVSFYVNGDLMKEQPIWDNSKAQFKPLSAKEIYVPVDPPARSDDQLYLPFITR